MMIGILMDKHYVIRQFGRTRMVKLVRRVWFGYLALDLTTKKIIRVFRSSILYQAPEGVGK